MDIIRRFFRDEEGADLVEYALLITFIAILVIVGVTFLGNSISNWFHGLGDQVNAWTGSV